MNFSLYHMFIEQQAPIYTCDKTDSTENNLIYVLASHVGEIGGASKATLLLCETLIEMGKQVHLFVTHRPEPPTNEKLKLHGVQVTVPWSNKGWRREIPHALLAAQVRLTTQRRKPALIHSVSLSAEARHLLRWPPAAPLYLWESTEALPHVGFVDKKIYKYLHKATAILVPSKTIADNVRRTYNYQGRMKLLPYWVKPPSLTEGKEAAPPHQRTHNLLYVGRLDLDKGFKYLFEAFRQLQKIYPQATLTVCGGGNIDTVRTLAGDNSQIEIRGYVSDTEYEQAMHHCDALVLPSLHEGYPLSLLEACARHKPIITTTVGSIPEVFEGRACALLVPPQDSHALAQAMLTLFSESNNLYLQRCADSNQLFEQVSAPSVVMGHLTQAYEAGEFDIL